MSIEPAGAPRRVLLEAAEFEVQEGSAVLRVAGEPLLVLPTLEQILSAVELTVDDIEVVHGAL